jgi:mannose-6-phosphate isomerase-like protein (cupin superfamily)
MKRTRRTGSSNELEKGLRISIRGPETVRALRALRMQMKTWGLTMPRAQPLVLDFGLGDFGSTGLIEYWIANEVEAGYCGKYLFVFDGQSCPMHRHKTKHETFFIVRGSVKMTCGGRTRRMGPGAVLPVAPGTKHGFTGIGPALLLEISKPCFIDDNYFEDTRIPIGGNYRGKAT